MDEKLQELIKNFEKKLSEAQDARQEVMDYLEDNYDIDTRENWETLELETNWCYDIDTDGIKYLIEQSEKESEEYE